MSEKDASKFIPERLRQSAVHFPQMIVISTVYPCNYGCPFCPYSDGNSELRAGYHNAGGDYIPVPLWQKIAQEAGPYGSWLRCTGGGEPMMHKHMPEMIEFAKAQGAKIWLNTNGSLFGPSDSRKANLHRIIEAQADLIEFSMDAGDHETYAKVRPPLKGTRADSEKRWDEVVSSVRHALELRRDLRSATRIVVSMIRQKELDGKLEEARAFWLEDVGVDEVITRKFLSWDDNTAISLEQALDVELYPSSWEKPKGPCVWPFERMNIDTLGRVALCGQDIAFRTAKLFPNVNDSSIQEIWKGKIFNEYRKFHMRGEGDDLFPCKGCSAWHAGVRDWKYGWIQVLQKSGDKVKDLFEHDLGVEVELATPEE